MTAKKSVNKKAKRTEKKKVRDTAPPATSTELPPPPKRPSQAAQPLAPKRPPIEVKTEDGKMWSHVRQKWLVETPEERVRQQFMTVLANEYGYSIEQIQEEESVTGRGSGQARADFIIWRSVQDKLDQKPPLIVIECKADNVTIQAKDYYQGDHYARMCAAPFFVTHNSRETRFWRVRKDKMPGYIEEIENIPHADASDKQIEELVAKLRIFKEDEFADLLHQCHNVIRNREHLDPAAAFDEIAKILFIKSWVEREMRRKKQRQNLFSADYLDDQLGDYPLQDLFEKTKEGFKKDRIFDEHERLNLKPATGREIVRLLERYNLSDTSEDVKGIAFERFLGRTFRGEIGQFFTPRTIVEFMVKMVGPSETDTVCDPGSGSGGFLIRFFEIVREQILSDADRQYQEFVESTESKKLSAKVKAERLREKFDEIQKTIDQTRKESRLWNLANRRIYGCDANDRMARTSKMNMIMHGDGHGGVHHHNGFINANGIFEGRFDIILTNPPFGASVEPTDVITQGDVEVPDEEYEQCAGLYGKPYKEAHARVKAAVGKPIASLFDLPNGGSNKVKTEILFLERCLALLRPGGRLGIVLPEGILNNPSPFYIRLREFCEDRAFLRAVVSLPQETFFSSGASVKASLLFMQKFTEEEKVRFDKTRAAAVAEVNAKYATEIAAETTRLEAEIVVAKKAKDSGRRKAAQQELAAYLARVDSAKAVETRALLKERSDYAVFLYQAERVGITATGEADKNELYPNDAKPDGVTQTCLELYWQFRDSPSLFASTE